MKADTYAQEIIGKTAKVVESKNKNDVGLEGKIVDETKKTIVLETKNDKKTLFKNNITLMINNQKIKGQNLMKRSEERIK